MTENISEAKKSLTQKPVFATSAERVAILNEIKSSYKELPHPLRFSRHLSILLERVSVPLEKYDLVAGRCVDRELTSDEEAAFRAFVKHPDFQGRLTFLGSGHCTYSWDMVLEQGLSGMRRMAQDTLAHADNEDKKVFLSAIIEIYDAISAYMMRYAKKAESMGLLNLAEDLRIAANEKPNSFTSALQLLWIITLIDCAYITENPTLTLGRLDVILYPYYKADIESGRLTKDRAKEYVIDYYCKHNLIMGRGEHQLGDDTNSTTFNRICNFDAPQYLLLGGIDKDGRPVANELTELFAECIIPEFKNPVIVVRYVKDMDKDNPKLWRTLTDKALQSASLMFYNDDNVVSTLKRVGLPEHEAREYAHFGCNWCSTGDNGAWMAGGPSAANYGVLSSQEKEEMCIPYMRVNADHGWPEDLMICLEEICGLCDKNEICEDDITIDMIRDAFLKRMSDFIDRKLKVLSRELSARKRRPSAVLNFTDCFTRASLNSGECFSAGAKYHFEQQAFQMFATVVDSFIAIDSLVIREKKLTLRELVKALRADFDGYGHVLAMCQKADKYGMDTELSNSHVKILAGRATTMVIEKSRPYFEKEGLFLMPSMQSDTWHLKYGEQYCATPDGRRANTPFSQNTRPSNGSCTNGLTGMFNSMLMLPSDGLASGALNLDVDEKQFAGEEGRALFATLLAVYFNRGGLHAQVSCAGAERLLKAQEEPENYRDIRVRVTGYSGIFVDMCKRLQDDVIERFK